ncbi:type II secretion system F family protein [Bacillus horti]|uniref:Tight adherence protein B n=1 Tax=Caldalkalibacillus horti TaxID=77523 RepID=A0ABT9VW62_9BACI|nr:type II secretion system F family protein [Bacillus horti]MDQ0165213.1 tight adherence protein B [Bacillus horti]
MLDLFIVLTLSIFCFFIAVFFIWKRISYKQANKRMKPWFKEYAGDERSSFFLALGDKYDQSELSEDLRKRLKQANLSIKPSEFTGLRIVIFLVLWALFGMVLGFVFPLDLALAHLTVWLSSKFYLSSRKNKRSKDFNQQLPEICRMLSSTVKAGLTLNQGVSRLGREFSAPAGQEFATMDRELSLGDNFDAVFNRLKERISSKELNIFVNTVVIQRKVGGNLAEVLQLMAETLEERSRINKEVDTVTAESKYVAYILPVLPIIMAFMMNMIIPGFLEPLFSPIGLILLAVCAGIQILAFIIIKRISEVKV